MMSPSVLTIGHQIAEATGPAPRPSLKTRALARRLVRMPEPERVSANIRFPAACGSGS
jgi:hypothetical protein